MLFLNSSNNTEGMNRVTLWFKSSVQERQYRNQSDAQFKYNIACAALLFALLAFIQLLTVERWVTLTIQTQCWINNFWCLTRNTLRPYSCRSGSRRGSESKFFNYQLFLKYFTFVLTYNFLLTYLVTDSAFIHLYIFVK